MKKQFMYAALLGLVVSGSWGSIPRLASAEGGFTDSLPIWAKSDIAYVASKGYMKGDQQGKFNPNATISRAEFAAILARASDNTPDAARQGFEHLSGWSKEEVNAAVSKGFISVSDYKGGFHPDAPLTRRELAKWVASGLAAKDADFKAALSDTADTLVPVAEYYKGGLEKEDYPYVSVAMGTGLMTGYPDGSFGPGQTTSRAEAAVILRRFEAIQDKKANSFQDLKEFREVGLTGTNAISMGYKYGLDEQGNESSFKSIRNKPEILYNNIATAKINRFIVAMSTNPKKIVNLYGKFFIDKDYSFGRQMGSEHFEVFEEISYTSHIVNMDSSKYLNASTQWMFVLPGFQSGAVIKNGIRVLPRFKDISGAFLEKDKETTFWTVGSINNNYINSITSNGATATVQNKSFYMYVPEKGLGN
ncbi:hypothetical protein J2Z69_000357 [Paenibacillus shirakamiensis]|uniref:SLH domain-containing protein n=1 Tax=Paenibacillus shirakamiensis TaxID=1265935 RepID=A0ABS4JC82_9BACL|nr:S-layer homology domain-containing protein [Paenibacillus shirakamiensis]MBP1999338.1 hypothetical protein [Paenibacillus shirakamiensis]